MYADIPAKLLESKSKPANPVNDPILDGIDPIRHTPEIINIQCYVIHIPHKTAASQTPLIYNMPQNNL